MKIIFMGTPDFSTGVLQKLIDEQYEITAVITQPDKPKGRGFGMQYPPVKELALKYDLPVYQPDKVKSPEFVQTLSEIPGDICIVVAFGQILNHDILTMKKYGCINVHASILPNYRGAAPIQWAILDGCKTTGVTIMQMDEGLDTGDIISSEQIEIAPDETGGSLFDKLSLLGASLCVKTLKEIEAGSVHPIPQPETQTDYAKMITRDMGKIDFHKSAVEIERMVRGFNPWPSAYTVFNGKILKIWRAETVDKDSSKEPGTITHVEKEFFTVQTGRGELKILELQLEGRKRMKTADFLRGVALDEGIVLG